MSAQLQPAPFRKSPHSHRVFSAYENTVFARLHAGEISMTTAMGELQTGEIPLRRHYQQLYGKRLEIRRPIHIWTEADRPALLDYRDGNLSMTELCKRLRTSAPSVRKAMRDMGIALPSPVKTARDHSYEPMIKGVWFPIAHKEAGASDWTPLAGAPLTIREAHALREAGQAFTAQRRVDGGFDLEVFIKAKQGRKR